MSLAYLRVDSWIAGGDSNLHTELQLPLAHQILHQAPGLLPSVKSQLNANSRCCLGFAFPN